MKTIRLALLGFGNAGRAFAKMLQEHMEQIQEEYGITPVATVLATGSHGNLYNPDGLDLEKARIDREYDEPIGSTEGANRWSSLSTMELVEQGEYDVLIEMTPLNIHTGQPAIDHIRTAMHRGKHVITANKGPVAWAYSELRDLAKENNLLFFYETTVMDGTPVFNLAEHTLKMARITEVSGILNSTTNFILEELAAGADMEDIMTRGREMGFIEADSAMDIEGYDAAAKITALLNVLMHADLTPDQVDRKGIEDIGVAEIERAAEHGNVIKLLCRGWRREDGSVAASVQPTEIPKTDLLASINSTTSIVSITSDVMKKVSVVEHEPEIEQTAYGVFGDLLRVLEGVNLKK